MLTRVYRSPWDSLRGFHGELDRLYNTNTARPMDAASDWVPPVDIKEGRDAYEVSADIPGADPKDINVSLEDSVLTVKGGRKAESKDEGEGYTRTERAYGSFYRRFTLPDTADTDKISAKIKHGVLKLHIPKKNKALPKRIAVEG